MVAEASLDLSVHQCCVTAMHTVPPAKKILTRTILAPPHLLRLLVTDHDPGPFLEFLDVHAAMERRRPAGSAGRERDGEARSSSGGRRCDGRQRPDGDAGILTDRP
jgi:hypothetical protein